MPEETRNKSARIICCLSVIAIISKILGFVEKIVMAHFFGTSGSSDVYFAITNIILTLTFMVKELVYPSVLPVFSRTLVHPPEISGSLFRKLFLSLCTILIIVAILMVIFSK